MTMPCDGTAPPEFAAFTRTLRADMATKGWHFHKASNGPFDRFQVLGERGCGTNVIRKTVQDTLILKKTEALGWKHGFPAMIAIPQTFLTICAVRSAPAWAMSLYNRPWHGTPAMQRLDFHGFIRSPWQSYVDKISHFAHIPANLHPQGADLQWDRHPVTGTVFETIFDMRTLKHRALLGLPARGASVVYVSLDAFTANPEGFLSDLAQTFDLRLQPNGYTPVTRRMGTRWTAAVTDRHPAPATWSAEDTAWMHSRLDPVTETALGFAPPP